MKTDGKFIIQSGGITQGIQKELGLSNQECKQLGSIWNQIINEFEGETNGQKNMTVSSNRNVTPNQGNNYLVHPKAVIEFSKDCWKRIVSLVNNALHKNIEVEDNNTQSSASISESETPVANKNPDLEEVDLASKVGDEKVEEYKRYCQELVENAKQILIDKQKDFGLTQNEIDYINSIDYESIKYGSARWDKQAKRIHINYNDQNLIEAFNNTNPNIPLKPDVGYFVKLILHEVKHADLNTNQNTQNEERACEGRALKSAYRLFANADNIDKQKYNMLLPDSRNKAHRCIMLSDLGDGTEIDETKLQEYLNQWLIDCGYSERLEVGSTEYKY